MIGLTKLVRRPDQPDNEGSKAKGRNRAVVQIHSSNVIDRVVIVRDRYGCGGGIYALFDELCRHLDADVRLVDVGRPHHYFAGKCVPWWLRTRIRWISDAGALVVAILMHRPKLVHLNTGLDKEERSLTRDAVNLRIAKALGCKVLMQWHGWDHPAAGGLEFPGGNGGWLHRSYRQADMHLVLASSFRQDLQRWGFNQVHLVTTVASDEILNAAAGSAEKKFPSEMLFLSRVEQAKGVWELLEAYSILRKRNLSCCLTIAGDGPDLEAVKQHAAELGLHDISFPGFVTGVAKNECFRRSAIFCFPSHSEGMPLAVLEALAMGLPVVATRVGGLADILEDSVTGLFVELDRTNQPHICPLELANRIELLMKDKALSRRISAANALLAKERFSPEKVARDLRSLYDLTVRKCPT